MRGLLGAHRDLTRFKPTHSDLATLRGAWRQHPRYRGCVGHWLLGEGGGRVVADVSLYGQQGTLTNFAPAAWAQGQSGAVPVLDGIDEFVTIPSGVQFNLSGDFTFSARSRIDVLSGEGNDVLVAKVSAADDTQFYWAILTSGTMYFLYYNAGAHEHTFVVPSAVEEGREYLYGLTCRGASLQAYRDGLPLGAPQTKTSTIVAHTEPMTFGVANPNLVFVPTQGVVHDVRLYSVGLSAAQMLSLVTAPWVEFAAPASGAGTSMGSDTFPAWLGIAQRGYAPLVAQ